MKQERKWLLAGAKSLRWKYITKREIQFSLWHTVLILPQIPDKPWKTFVRNSRPRPRMKCESLDRRLRVGVRARPRLYTEGRLFQNLGVVDVLPCRCEKRLRTYNPEQCVLSSDNTLELSFTKEYTEHKNTEHWLAEWMWQWIREYSQRKLQALSNSNRILLVFGSYVQPVHGRKIVLSFLTSWSWTPSMNRFARFALISLPVRWV